MDQILEKLEEYVLDEDKIITIASFACDAKISLVDAKEALNNYVEINRESGKIHVTFLLSGVTQKGQQTAVIVVKDEDLTEKKRLFENDVSQTVFSIQKSKKVDLNLIALADPFNDKVLESPLPGLIISKNCTNRTIKKKIIPPAPQPKPSIFGKQNSQKSGDGLSEKNEAASSNTKQKSSQGGIANMFNKMSQNKSDDVKPKQGKDKCKTKNAGLSGFFMKMSSSSENLGKKEIKSEEIVPPKKEKISPKKEKEDRKDLFDSDSNDEIEQMVIKMDVDVVKEEKTKKTEMKGPEKKPVKKRRAKNEADKRHSTKRRKRIVDAEDSDSDDIFADSEKEENSLSEPDVEPLEEVKKPLPIKNRRKKAVDRTYQDEEGFIVTRKEYIYETASEDENEEPKKATAPDKPKPNVLSKKSNSSNSDVDAIDGTLQKGKGGKKGAKKSAGNQPTLMNFFTKK